MQFALVSSIDSVDNALYAMGIGAAWQIYGTRLAESLLWFLWLRSYHLT